MNLDEIGVKHSTDKSSLLHHYLSLYELLFEPLRYKDIKILEIGVQFGLSLKMWREYFPNAHIVGIDSVDNSATWIPEPNRGMDIRIRDAYCLDTVRQVGDQRFDIIIDDGSHVPEHQQFFVKHYIPLLTSTGILIVEDVPSPDVIPELVSMLPEGFSSIAVDMTQASVPSMPSRLFIAWRNK